MKRWSTLSPGPNRVKNRRHPLRDAYDAVVSPRTVPRLGAVAIVVLIGCDPPSLTPNGVVGAFGKVGLGPGAFCYPRAIAADPGGSVLVVDKAGRVQRFSAEGTFEVAWQMPETDLGKPVGLTVDHDGRILVADTHYHRVLVYDQFGKVAASFGSEGTGDGEFELPTDVAVDKDGFIYVSEYHANDRITKWSPDLRFVAAIGDQPINGKRLSRPAGIDIDDEGTLWVADACNHRLVRFSLEGEVLGTVGRFGREPGEMRYPYDVDALADGSILVCEYGGDRLQWFSKEGRSLRVWGSSGRRLGELSGPWGAAEGANGYVYIVDSLNSRVQILKP
ncbi:MAG: 6-bladed beta-propeller [Phycisphaerae bacterium]